MEKPGAPMAGIAGKMQANAPVPDSTRKPQQSQVRRGLFDVRTLSFSSLILHHNFVPAAHAERIRYRPSVGASVV